MVLPLHEEQVKTYRSLASIIRFIGLGVASDVADGCGDNRSSNLVGVTVTTGECSSAFIWIVGGAFKLWIMYNFILKVARDSDWKEHKAKKAQ